MSVISFPLNRFLAAIAPPVAAIVLVTFANPSRRFVLSWDEQKEIELRAEDAHTICLRSIRSFSRGQCERFVINRSFLPTDCFSSLRGILSRKFIRLFFKKYKNRHASRCIRIVTIKRRKLFSHIYTAQESVLIEILYSFYFWIIHAQQANQC